MIQTQATGWAGRRELQPARDIRGRCHRMGIGAGRPAGKELPRRRLATET